jgi:LysR family transcriptional regulator, transcriptional activator of nhaA
MEWLNFHHLFYFWRIAREGGLAKAADTLHLTHSTLSAQLRSLEAFFGGPLFERRGRRLVLTPLGEEAALYADDIFRLGRELVDTARGRAAQRSRSLRVGAVGSMPKSVVYRLLEPAMAAPGFGSLYARQDHPAQLLEELGAGRLHIVLADAPPPESAAQRVYAHPLGESKVLLFATSQLARQYRKGFPASLDDAPILLPTPHAGLRSAIDRWFIEHRLRPRVAGEFDDAGLMRVAGARGHGLLPVRSALRAEVEDAHAMRLVGPLDGVVERYYLISAEKRVKHPAALALIEAARLRLEGGMSTGSSRRRVSPVT